MQRYNIYPKFSKKFIIIQKKAYLHPGFSLVLYAGDKINRDRNRGAGKQKKVFSKIFLYLCIVKYIHLCVKLR